MPPDTSFDPRPVERRLRDASDAYYRGAPILSDDEYDELRDLHALERRRNPEHPQWADTILDAVGAPPPPAGLSKVAHSHPMLSLDNVFVGDDDSLAELEGWCAAIAAQHGAGTRLILEPKIDGLSVALTYRDGELERAVTRGDGSVGEDITANVLAARIAPPRIPCRLGEGCEPQVMHGEIFMTFADFADLNARAESAGEEPYANPRNAAAGIIRRHDPSQVRGLSLLVHGFATPAGTLYSHEAARLNAAGDLHTPPSTAIAAGSPLVFGSGSAMQRLFAGLCDFPIDGVVAKVDDLELRAKMGCTSRAPRWAVALKFRQETAETRVREIAVQVGRSGVLTPVAELEPVQLDGSTVGRASLHNQDQVNRLGIRPGDRVLVRKAGAIIPEVVRSVTYADMGPRGQEARGKWLLPEHIGQQCPSCGHGELKQRMVGEATVWLCGNTAGCPAQMGAWVEHMASRACLDLDQLGGEACDEIGRLAKGEGIGHPFDVLGKPAGWFAALSWETRSGGRMTFGESRAAKVAEAISRARLLPLNRWVAALGLPSIGANTSKEISRLCPDAAALVRSCCDPEGVFGTMADSLGGDKVRYDKLKLLYGVSPRLGPVSLRVLVDYARSEEGRRRLSQIPGTARSDNYQDASAPQVGGPLSGKTFVVTGTLSVPRGEIQSLIESAGGKVSGSVSAKTDYLVAGEKAGSKLDKATKLGVSILSEAELRGMVS